MADAGDLKSPGGNLMRVRVPPPAPGLLDHPSGIGNPLRLRRLCGFAESCTGETSVLKNHGRTACPIKLWPAGLVFLSEPYTLPFEWESRASGRATLVSVRFKA